MKIKLYSYFPNNKNPNTHIIRILKIISKNKSIIDNEILLGIEIFFSFNIIALKGTFNWNGESHNAILDINSNFTKNSNGTSVNVDV